MTDEEKQTFRQRWLASTAEDAGLTDPPDVPFERWVSGADYGTAVGGCLKDAGFDAVWDGRFGFDFPEGVPPAQAKALALAQYACNARYSIDPVFMQEWTPEQVGLLYDYWDQYYVPCVEAHGVSVDTSERPSRDAFVASFATTERSRWWPEDSVTRLPAQQAKAVSRECSVYPPDDVFYGVSR